MPLKISLSKMIGRIIETYPQASLPIEEFTAYKKECLEFGDIPAPSQTIQRQYPAHIETIGRDKLATHPIDARAEELHHAHIWQEGCVWSEKSGDLKVQWASTSDSYIVYSYFIDRNNEHHFHVIDYCEDKAHTLIKDKKQITKWTNAAKVHRIANQGLYGVKS